MTIIAALVNVAQFWFEKLLSSTFIRHHWLSVHIEDVPHFGDVGRDGQDQGVVSF